MNYKERNFEEHIEGYLFKFGGYAISSGEGYDALKGYNPQSLISFIKNSQPEKWKKFCEKHDKPVEYFLKKVERHIKEFGLLQTLRDKIKLDGLDFKLAYFKPESNLNEKLIELYNKNEFECVRQLHYSFKNENSVDITLFLNGFPVSILELKNQYTGQSVENAIYQFKNDRDPEEPIFKFNERCLIYFAVDLYECYMTTKLNGKKTYFIPFNQGSNGAGNIGGAGNPNNENGFGTAYLWEKILQKDELMNIISKYMHLEIEKGLNWKNGKMIFPRYHQLDVVNKLVADISKNNSGKNYLIQHSAGSGKSNSIAWLAYRLSNLQINDEKIFNSVIVITDRVVLDKQLQDTIYQFEHVDGTVIPIDKGSQQLKDAINSGKKIIISTLQKFPFIYKDIVSLNKKFAIIIDEAHSSQSGRSAIKLKAGLSNPEEILEEYAKQELLEEKNIKDEEDKLLEEIAAHGMHKNLSFIAFTATPKDKTLQMFGKKMNDGSYRPYHIYSMQQAIDEKFILDVLKNYMTYDMYYKIAKTGEDDPEIHKSIGMKIISRYESLHPHNISQKAAIMIEHFRNTTKYKIGGKAKAMLVTSSRLHAVRYLKEFRRYIKENNIDDIDVLVAFSGEVFDDGERTTESKLNIDYKGNNEMINPNQLKKRFHESYNVLIVADKYQTGFDEPLLHTMFVDKKLSGVKAVQTLSRLNRTCPGKNDTFVLDFVNKPEEIQTSFQQYYQATILTEGVDPNSVYEIYERIKAYRIFNDQECCEFAKQYYSTDEDMSKLNGILYPAREKFKELDKEDKYNFKHALQSFIRAYQFIVQVDRLMDVDIQQKYIYCKYLNQVLPKDNIETPKIEDDISLEFYRLEKKFEGSIELTKEEGEIEPPKGTVGKKEEEKDSLSNIVNKINEKYGTKFTHMDKVMEQITEDFLDDETMVNYAKNNEPEAFRKIYNEEFKKKALSRYMQNEEMFNKMMSEEGMMEEFMANMFKLIYNKLKNK